MENLRDCDRVQRNQQIEYQFFADNTRGDFPVNDFCNSKITEDDSRYIANILIREFNERNH